MEVEHVHSYMERCRQRHRNQGAHPRSLSWSLWTWRACSSSSGFISRLVHWPVGWCVYSVVLSQYTSLVIHPLLNHPSCFCTMELAFLTNTSIYIVATSLMHTLNVQGPDWSTISTNLSNEDASLFLNTELFSSHNSISTVQNSLHYANVCLLTANNSRCLHNTCPNNSCSAWSSILWICSGGGFIQILQQAKSKLSCVE